MNKRKLHHAKYISLMLIYVSNLKIFLDQWFDKALNFWANGTQESHQVVQVPSLSII